METVSTIEVLVALADGQRVGQLRRTMSGAAIEQSRSTRRNLERAQKAALRGISSTGAARRTAWGSAVSSTTGLLAMHEMLSQLRGLERRASELTEPTTHAATRLLELGLVDLPEAMVTPEVRAQRAELAATGGDPARFARSLLGPATPVQVDGPSAAITVMSQLRLKALHATVMGQVRDATPDPAAATESELAALTDETSTQVRAVRDLARDTARELARGSASPAAALALWGALFRFEEWLVAAAPRFARASAAASARVHADPVGEGEVWARRFARAYDGLRFGLAFDAAVRAVLQAWATGDGATLQRLADARDLPATPARTEHVHSSLSGVAKLPLRAPVEVQGLVTAADVRVGGPSNRTVLTLGVSGDVQVLVPHVAIDSFGVTEGVWVQVRGHAFPGGKDGLTGPVVMAGRVSGEAAARTSLTDALVHLGRRGFALRPSGLDIVAGRPAGRVEAMNEIARATRND